MAVQTALPDTFSAQPGSGLAYRADVDGLRGIAILAVVAFHAFPSWVSGGFVGVDVFFVISGFLITGIIADGLERQKFSFAHFYARRVRRLFPALAVVLAACLVVGWFELLPPELALLSGVVALTFERRPELVRGLEVGARFADRFEVAVEADRAGAVAVAEHPSVHLCAELAHLGALRGRREFLGCVV